MIYRDGTMENDQPAAPRPSRPSGLRATNYASPLVTVRAFAHMGLGHWHWHWMQEQEQGAVVLAVMILAHGSQEETKMASQVAGVVRRGQARVKTW